MIENNSTNRPNIVQSAESSSGATALAPASLFEVIWRHAWIPLGCTVLAVAAGIFYLARATPKYTSESKVYVEQSGPKIMGDKEQGVMTGGRNYLYTQMELIKATPIVSEALKKCDPKRMQTFFGVDNPVAFLKGALETTVGKKDDIISVSFEGPYPEEAAHIVNTVVDAYVTFHGTRKKSTASEVLKVLQKEKLERDKELSEAMRAALEFKEQNEELALETSRGDMILSRLQRLAQVLTEAELSTMEAKSRLDAAKELVENPEEMMLFVEAQQVNRLFTRGDSERNTLRIKLEQLEQSYADRLARVTEDHPAVRALNEQIMRIRAKLKELDKQSALAQLAAYEQEYFTAQDKKSQLENQYSEQRQVALQLQSQLSEYTLLQADWDRAQKQCELLDARIKEVNLSEDAADVLNIAILEVATPGDSPSAPQRERTMAMAMVLGLILGSGLALLRDMMDHRIQSADEVSALLGVALLGTVPSMGKREKANVRGRKVHLDSHSTVAEAFRTIRTSIFFSVPQDQARIIQLTSPMPGEGKSTLISNTAIAMAQSGQRVLLIDADFRRPTQFQIFDVSRDKGLSGVLSGMQSLDDALVQTGIENLSLLPSGPEVPNPAELLGSQAFKDLLADLASRFDRVLVDSPPVVPVADASILATVCDITLLAVRAEKSTRKALEQAKSNLSGVGARVIGAIVNDVKHSKGRYGYYGYGYGYGDSSKKDGNGRKSGPKSLEGSSRVASSDTDREAVISNDAIPG